MTTKLKNKLQGFAAATAIAASPTAAYAQNPFPINADQLQHTPFIENLLTRMNKAPACNPHYGSTLIANVTTTQPWADKGNRTNHITLSNYDGKPGVEGVLTVKPTDKWVTISGDDSRPFVTATMPSAMYLGTDGQGRGIISLDSLRAHKKSDITLEGAALVYNDLNSKVNCKEDYKLHIFLPKAGTTMVSPYARVAVMQAADSLERSERMKGDSANRASIDSLGNAFSAYRQDQNTMNDAVTHGIDAQGNRITKLERTTDSIKNAAKATSAYAPKETAAPTRVYQQPRDAVRESVNPTPSTKYVAPTMENGRGYFIIGLTGGTENSTMSLNAGSAALGGVPGSQDGTFVGGYALGMIPISNGEIVMSGLGAKTSGSIKVDNPRTGGLNSAMSGVDADVEAMLNYRPIGKTLGLAAKAGFEYANTDNSDFGTQSQMRPSLGLGANIGSPVFNVSALLLYEGSGANSGAQKDPTGYGLEAMVDGHSKGIPVLVRLHGSKVSSDGYSRTSFGGDADFGIAKGLTGRLGYRVDSDKQGLNTDRTRLTAGLGYTFK